MEQWAIKDPVENYRKYLKENKILTEEFDEALRSEIKLEINENLVGQCRTRNRSNIMKN
jgi:2-oxoisovalerate dehydrogenase E1 component